MNKSSAHLVAFVLSSAFFVVTLPTQLVHSAGRCTCSDIDKIQSHLDRVTKSEEAWKYIFAWARELYRDVDLPKSNDDLNQKFVQLFSTSESQWDDLIKQGPLKERKIFNKVAGLSEKGEPIVEADFSKNNCDDVIEAERAHERAHKDFFLSFPKILDVAMESRLLRLRSESEVVSYRTQKEFLRSKLTELKRKYGSKCKSYRPLKNDFLIFSGVICNLENPFTVTYSAVSVPFTGTYTFVPSSATAGTWSGSGAGSMGGATHAVNDIGGSYTIEGADTDTPKILTVAGQQGSSTVITPRNAVTVPSSASGMMGHIDLVPLESDECNEP